MADKPEHKPTYRRLVWCRAYTDWKAALQARLIWTVVLAIVGFTLAAFTGARLMPGPVEIGAACGIGIAAALYIAWFRLRAPAKIWADDQSSLSLLQNQLDQQRKLDLPTVIETRLRLEMGSASPYLPDDRIKLADARIETIKSEIGSENMSHAQEVMIISKILPEITSGCSKGSGRIKLIQKITDLVSVIESRL